MEQNRSNNKIRITLIIVTILIAAVSTGLYLQEKEISKIKDKLDLSNQPEKSRTTDLSSSKQNIPSFEEEPYIMKIKELEAQIVEMNELSDSLENDIKEYEEQYGLEASSLSQNNFAETSRVNGDFIIRRGFTRTYKEFFEEYEYAPELQEKYFDLLIEKNNAVKSLAPDLFNFLMDSTKDEIEEMQQKSEKLNAEYDEKIAELLSDDGLYALKEYEKYSSERHFLRDFKTMLDGDKLEREKEKKLLSLMHEHRIIYDEENRKNAFNYGPDRKGPDKETLDRLTREQDERTKKLYANYIEAAKNVLSESQMQKFEGLLI